MKKVLIWIAISFIVLLIFPLIVSFFPSLDRSIIDMKYFFLNPLFFLILGIFTGRRDKKQCYLFLIALAFAFVGDFLIWEGNFRVFVEIAITYSVISLIVAFVALFFSAYMHTTDKYRKKILKKVLLKPALISGIINCAGLLINLFFYAVTGDILLGYNGSGGECIQKFGFGVYVFQACPLAPSDSVDYPPEMSLDLFGFFLGFLGVFIIIFIICLIHDIYDSRSVIKKTDGEKR